MLARTTPESAESLFTAIATCTADQRPQKIDLLVGVYKDKDGRTPIMKAIQLAEERVLRQQETKNYLAVTGRNAFSTAILDLVLGRSEVRNRALGLQTVGGSGALRVVLELARRSNPTATVWLSDPGYPGHLAIANGVGLGVRFYPYEVTSSGMLRADVLLDTLDTARKGDIVILDASCHNPTGVDLPAEVWLAVGKLCVRHGLVPPRGCRISGTRARCRSGRSGPRNIDECGRARVRRLSVVPKRSECIERGRHSHRDCAPPGGDPTRIMQSLVQIAFSSVCRSSRSRCGHAWWRRYSAMPPCERYGRRSCCRMSQYLRHCRRRFAGAIENAAALGLEHVRNGNGIFSMLPLGSRQMRELRERFAIHGLQNGRVNLTGVSETQLQAIGAAVRAVI